MTNKTSFVIYRKRTSSSVWPSPIGNTFADHVPFLLWSGSTRIEEKLESGGRGSAGTGVRQLELLHTLQKYYHAGTSQFFKDVCFVRSLTPNVFCLACFIFVFNYSCHLQHAHMHRLVIRSYVALNICKCRIVYRT